MELTIYTLQLYTFKITYMYVQKYKNLYTINKR